MKSRFLLAVLLIYQCFGGLSAEASGEARIAIAANFAKPARALKTEFLKNRTEKIAFVSGSTGKLTALISRGAPIDAFFAADVESPLFLIANGKGERRSLVVYALGQLVVWHRPRIWPCRPKEILAEDIPIAIANERLAPYGRAAIQTLNSLSISTDLFFRADNVSQVFAYVKSGSAEVGFVAASDVVDRTGHCLWQVPANYHDPIEQAALLVTDNTVAKEFLAFVMSEDGQSMLADFGYAPGRKWQGRGRQYQGGQQ